MNDKAINLSQRKKFIFFLLYFFDGLNCIHDKLKKKRILKLCTIIYKCKIRLCLYDVSPFFSCYLSSVFSGIYKTEVVVCLSFTRRQCSRNFRRTMLLCWDQKGKFLFLWKLLEFTLAYHTEKLVEFVYIIFI